MARKTKPRRKPVKACTQPVRNTHPQFLQSQRELAGAGKWALFASTLNWVLLIFALLIFAMGCLWLYIAISQGGEIGRWLPLPSFIAFVLELFLFWRTAQRLKRYADSAREFAQTGREQARAACFMEMMGLLRLSVLATALLLGHLFLMIPW